MIDRLAIAIVVTEDYKAKCYAYAFEQLVKLWLVLVPVEHLLNLFASLAIASFYIYSLGCT